MAPQVQSCSPKLVSMSQSHRRGSTIDAAQFLDFSVVLVVLCVVSYMCSQLATSFQ